MRSLRGRRFALLELGIWKGDSLVMWRDSFPLATIVGIDLAPPTLKLGRRVHVVVGDQSDPELLGRVRAAHAPQGFDVIVDDASHIGQLSARSLQALYLNHLRPGGLYIIEDWGTGYLPQWPDGLEPSTTMGIRELDATAESADGEDATSGRRLPSHDAGMVGLVKRLVDHTASVTLNHHHPGWVSDLLPIEWMRVHDGLVILKRPAASPR
jgi:SAM-dependent methyltransferase